MLGCLVTISTSAGEDVIGDLGQFSQGNAVLGRGRREPDTRRRTRQPCCAWPGDSDVTVRKNLARAGTSSDTDDPTLDDGRKLPCTNRSFRVRVLLRATPHQVSRSTNAWTEVATHVARLYDDSII